MSRFTLRLLIFTIAAAAALAAATGILSRGGDGPSEHVSVRGETVLLHGTGLYRHMSAEVAPQGIAQDVVTLVVAIPLLLVALWWSERGSDRWAAGGSGRQTESDPGRGAGRGSGRQTESGPVRGAGRGSLRGRLLLAGTLGYFLVTYLFYLVMGTYNAMFLVYALLLATSFFAFAGVLLGFDLATLPGRFAAGAPARGAGIFLIANAAAIGLLWLGIVVPPLLDGTVIPVQVEHYTTLVVQGLDLGLLLPLAVVAGALLIRRRPLGFLLAPVYLVFLTLLMTALTAKIVAMGMLGYEIVPVVFIIPTLTVVAGVFAVRLLRAITDEAAEAPPASPDQSFRPAASRATRSASATPPPMPASPQ